MRTTPVSRTTRTAAIAAGAVVAAMLGGGATWALTDRAPSAGSAPAAVHVDPATAARTSFPGLVAATGEPMLPGLRSAAPRPGTIAHVAGPFDDRFGWHRLTLDAGTVTGTVTITSDVSDVLELQVLAGFYDRDGRFLGVGRFTHHLNEDKHATAGPPTELEQFRIDAPAGVRSRVASASVGVPVLVNE